MRDLAAAVVGAALLVTGGCGAADEAGSDEPTASSATVVLTITVKQSKDAEPKVYELTCDPAGGSHPQPEQACDALAEAGPDVFEPINPDMACTQIYGGPQEATVRGVVDGAKVERVFNRTNGCEISRWDALGTTFFVVPMQ